MCLSFFILQLPFSLSSPLSLPLNKSFVGAENRDNFTPLQSAPYSVISVTSKWWCIRKSFVSSSVQRSPLKRSGAVSWESELKYMRDQLSHLIFVSYAKWKWSALNHQVAYRLPINVFRRFSEGVSAISLEQWKKLKGKNLPPPRSVFRCPRVDEI